MKLFTFLAKERLQEITLAVSLIFLVTSPLFAQRGSDYNKGDSANFRHRPIHHFNDTIYAHRINDSIFLCHRFDTSFVRHVQEWNDTVYFHFHHHFDTAFAYKWRNHIDSLDSLRRNRFDSLRAHLIHHFDTICAQHIWRDSISGNDTICMNHWIDSIIIRHHRNYVIFLHHVRSEVDKKSIVSDVMAAVPSNSNTSIPVKVNIYPNPISESAVLQIANSRNALMFRLFDVTGKVVMSMENLSNGDIELNRNNLPAGMYFYQVLNSNSMISAGKLVIQ